jgi:hypothetical protein
MHILLFILYCGLCGFGILRMPFFMKSGIRPAVLLTLFGLHVLAGCVHNLIAWRFYPEHGDIWFYFQFSFLERHRLLHDPHLFLYYNSSWDAISHNAITFIQIILDAASFDDMWINTLLLSFPVFLGNTALYRVFRRQFPGSPLSAATAFLLPSTLFWTSCIHREAMLFMLLGLLFYWLDKAGSFKGARFSHKDGGLSRKSTRKSFFYASCAFLAIIFFRFAVAIALVPALLAWLFTLHPLPRRKGWIIGGVGASLLLLLFLAAPQLSTRWRRELATQQHSFLVLPGNSKLYLPELNDSWASLLEAAPAALRNGLFEPLPGSGGQQIYQLFALELLWLWAIVAAALLRLLILHKPTGPFPSDSLPPDRKRASDLRALSGSRCCILFALFGMLQIGLIIPFVGAIIRYRSIFLPFLVAPCLFSLRNWQPFQTFNTWLSRYFG